MTVSESDLIIDEKEYSVRIPSDALQCELLERGNYEEIDSWLTAADNFTTSVSTADLQCASLPCKLIGFKRVFPVDRQRIVLGREGFVPVTLAVLLAFGETYPEEQRLTQITTYSMFWQCEAFDKFPVLGMLDNQRYFGAAYSSELTSTARVLCTPK